MSPGPPPTAVDETAFAPREEMASRRLQVSPPSVERRTYARWGPRGTAAPTYTSTRFPFESPVGRGLHDLANIPGVVLIEGVLRERDGAVRGDESAPGEEIPLGLRDLGCGPVAASVVDWAM